MSDLFRAIRNLNICVRKTYPSLQQDTPWCCIFRFYVACLPWDSPLILSHFLSHNISLYVSGYHFHKQLNTEKKETEYWRCSIFIEKFIHVSLQILFTPLRIVIWLIRILIAFYANLPQAPTRFSSLDSIVQTVSVISTFQNRVSVDEKSQDLIGCNVATKSDHLD